MEIGETIVKARESLIIGVAHRLRHLENTRLRGTIIDLINGYIAI